MRSSDELAPLVSRSERPRATLDDVVVADGARRALAEVIAYIRALRAFNVLGAAIPCAVILGGGSARARREVIRAVAGTAEVPLHTISGRAIARLIADGEVGADAGRELIEHLIGQAKGSAPCVVWVDEPDILLRSADAGDGGATRAVLSALLLGLAMVQAWQEPGHAPSPPIVVIAAADDPGELTGGFLTPGRFIPVPIDDPSWHPQQITRDAPSAAAVAMAQEKLWRTLPPTIRARDPDLITARQQRGLWFLDVWSKTGEWLMSQQLDPRRCPMSGGLPERPH